MRIDYRLSIVLALVCTSCASEYLTSLETTIPHIERLYGIDVKSIPDRVMILYKQKHSYEAESYAEFEVPSGSTPVHTALHFLDEYAFFLLDEKVLNGMDIEVQAATFQSILRMRRKLLDLKPATDSSKMFSNEMIVSWIPWFCFLSIVAFYPIAGFLFIKLQKSIDELDEKKIVYERAIGKKTN